MVDEPWEQKWPVSISPVNHSITVIIVGEERCKCTRICLIYMLHASSYTSFISSLANQANYRLLATVLTFTSSTNDSKLYFSLQCIFTHL